MLSHAVPSHTRVLSRPAPRHGTWDMGPLPITTTDAACTLPSQTPRPPAQTGNAVRQPQIPGAGADEMQPKRREGTLVSSRLNDRQRSNAGADMVVVSFKPSGGLHLLAKSSIRLKRPSPKHAIRQSALSSLTWLHPNPICALAVTHLARLHGFGCRLHQQQVIHTITRPLRSTLLLRRACTYLGLHLPCVAGGVAAPIP
jgi:hypothetical protein